MEPNVRPARHIEMATPIAAGPRAGERPTAPQVVRLYEEGAPGAVGGTGTEVEYSAWGACLVRNVVDPTLTVFLPDPADATGAAVIVAPGGGFCWLSWDVEGTMVAEWLRDHGVAAFVLKYRTVDMGSSDAECDAKAGEVIEAMLALARVDDPSRVRAAKYPELARTIGFAEEDARQAVRHVRTHASEYGVATDRIGCMGFSAGGILAFSLALRPEATSRPDFIASVYSFSHDPLAVPADAPALFFSCALDDETIAPHAGETLDAWREAGASVEAHVYSLGGHGFGLRPQGLPVDTWIERFVEWLEVWVATHDAGTLA